MDRNMHVEVRNSSGFFMYLFTLFLQLIMHLFLSHLKNSVYIENSRCLKHFYHDEFFIIFYYINNF